MTMQHLPNLHEFLLDRATREDGGFVTDDLVQYLITLIVWLNTQFTHQELHQIAHNAVDTAVTHFGDFISVPEYQADSWRPAVDAGDLSAVPNGFNLSPQYLAEVAKRIEIEVPDFIPEDF